MRHSEPKYERPDIEAIRQRLGETERRDWDMFCYHAPDDLRALLAYIAHLEEQRDTYKSFYENDSRWDE